MRIVDTCSVKIERGSPGVAALTDVEAGGWAGEMVEGRVSETKKI